MSTDTTKEPCGHMGDTIRVKADEQALWGIENRTEAISNGW